MRALTSFSNAAKRMGHRLGARRCAAWLDYLHSGLVWDPAFKKKTEKAFSKFPWESAEFAPMGLSMMEDLLSGVGSLPQGDSERESIEAMFEAGLVSRFRNIQARVPEEGSVLGDARFTSLAFPASRSGSWGSLGGSSGSVALGSTIGEVVERVLPKLLASWERSSMDQSVREVKSENAGGTRKRIGV